MSDNQQADHLTEGNPLPYVLQTVTQFLVSIRSSSSFPAPLLICEQKNIETDRSNKPMVWDLPLLLSCVTDGHSNHLNYCTINDGDFLELNILFLLIEDDSESAVDTFGGSEGSLCPPPIVDQFRESVLQYSKDLLVPLHLVPIDRNARIQLLRPC
jgi:hypothetical protein